MKNLELKGIDLMKQTKDAVKTQPTDAEIERYIELSRQIGATHVAISVPLDIQADMVANGSTPSPRTITAFAQKFCDEIHDAGMSVIFRGTLCALEGIYDFAKEVGATRLALGTTSSAATDAQTTIYGKVYSYITSNPTFFADGDEWAIFPEQTGHGIFSADTSFLSHTSPTTEIVDNYATFFIDLKTVSEAAFVAINKTVTCGMSTNNYSEIASGWMQQELFDDAGYVVMDHYGSPANSRSPEEMASNLDTVYTNKGLPIYLQEWGLQNTYSSEYDKKAYLKRMLEVFKTRVNNNKLKRFNYWNLGPNSPETLTYVDGNNVRQLSIYGRILSDYYHGNESGRMPI